MDMVNQTGELESPRKVVSITEAARINGVTRQAIYVAIKQNKLRARKDSTRWTIDLDDLEDYRRNKYSRTKSTFVDLNRSICPLLFSNWELKP
jgi:excisionase family DNA binding protein